MLFSGFFTIISFKKIQLQKVPPLPSFAGAIYSTLLGIVIVVILHFLKISSSKLFTLFPI